MKKALLYFVAFLFVQVCFSQEVATYKGFIELANYKRLPVKKEATVYVFENGITLKTKYGVYERYAGYFSKDSDQLGLKEGEYLVDLNDSAYDENGTMLVTIKEKEVINTETFDYEMKFMITIVIREFEKNEVLTFIGDKLDLD